VPVANTIWLLSDYSNGITGEIVHVEGGFHAIGPPRSCPPDGYAEPVRSRWVHPGQQHGRR
jgi:hypothetical protein